LVILSCQSILTSFSLVCPPARKTAYSSTEGFARHILPACVGSKRF
jgi:hypothetical protein